MRVGFFAVLCFSATEALAQPLNLAWDAPAGCPSQASVLQGVERIVGRPSDELAVPWTSARVAVMRQQEGWLLQVIVVSVDGTKNERLLAAASCAEAAEAASVVLATSLAAAWPTTALADTPAPGPSGPPPSATNASPAPQATLPAHALPPTTPQSTAPQPTAAPPAPGATPVSVSATAAAPPPAAPATADQPTPPRAQPSSSIVGSLGARLGLDTSLLGEPTAIVGLVGGAEFHPASVRAFASATDSVDQEAPATQGGARLALYAGGLQGCLSIAGVTLRVEGCAGGQVGILRADGYGVAGTHVDSVFWSAGQGSAVLRWRRGASGSLWLEAEVIVPLRRLYVELAGSELHRTPGASAQLWLGFSLDL